MSFASASFHKEGRMDAEAGSKPAVDSSPGQRDSAGFGELRQSLGAPEVCRLHGAADGVGYELTWTSTLAVGGKKKSFLRLCRCLGFILCAVTQALLKFKA